MFAVEQILHENIDFFTPMLTGERGLGISLAQVCSVVDDSEFALHSLEQFKTTLMWKYKIEPALESARVLRKLCEVSNHP